MKNLWIISFLLFPGVLLGQKIITLSVNQPPEFGFSVNKTDTTIVRGDSVELGTDMIVFGGSGQYIYHWEPTKTLSDSTILNPVASPADTTSYILTVTDENGCSFSVAYTVNVQEQAVGIPQIPAPSALQAVLYPNPNNGTFQVKITGKPAPELEVFLYSETGSLLQQKTIRRFSGELTETFRLSPVRGTYCLQLKAGGEVISRQFVVH